ncbi:MAG: histidine triad nucleotide-binding protein [Actinobacteria bacterium]|nr:histidine triad nucleotide-binding protein [Actinomycetota bacterium]MCB9413292.1 histidine triad nucleotide-binding protein [Actinomycetota bacterium]
MMGSMSSCPFCLIAAGSIDADIVYSDDQVVAFRDINPQAPVHVLVIPREHHANVAELARADSEQLAALLAAAAQVAESEQLAAGYRVVINTGGDGGQTVDHVHAHVLGGRHLTWPPG